MTARIALAALCLTLLVPVSARADDMVWATGRIFAEDGVTPIPGARVAVYDQKNKVIDYVQTDRDGNYALAVPSSAMNLNKSSNGIFYQVTKLVGGVGKIASMPLQAGIKAAVAVSAATDPLTKVGINTAGNLATSIAEGMGQAGKKTDMPVRKLPGAIVMKVSAPGRADAVAVARVYWMQAEVYKVGGREQRSLVAWMDPARMSVANAKEPSSIVSTFLVFTEAKVEPSIIERGQTATITARISAPPEPRTPFVVVARNSRSKQYVLLDHVNDNLYKGTIVVDKRMPSDDQVYTILAYAEEEAKPGRRNDAESAIDHAGAWDPHRPYVYNPLLLVSRNRAEVTLTVVGKNRR